MVFNRAIRVDWQPSEQWSLATAWVRANMLLAESDSQVVDQDVFIFDADETALQVQPSANAGPRRTEVLLLPLQLSLLLPDVAAVPPLVTTNGAHSRRFVWQKGPPVARPYGRFRLEAWRMARLQRVQKDGNDTVEVLKDLLITQLGPAGVPQQSIRNIVL